MPCNKRSMDRELSPEQRRRPWWIAARRILVGALLVVTLAWAGQRMLTSTIALSDVRVATVERGTLQASVSSTGVIVPRTEQTVSSPVSAEIRTVHVSPGETVTKGQLMLELDTTASAMSLSNLDEQLALRRAEIRSMDLQLSDSIRQARSRSDLLEIDLESRNVMLARLEQLADTGVVSQTELLEAQLNVKRTEVEFEQIGAEIVSLEQRREADLERLELDFSIARSQREDQARRVAMSDVRATRDGVVTFLVQEAGSFVAEGQALATIAATDEFRVEASVSDFYGPRLRPNQRVLISSATSEFGGHLRRILSVAESSRLDLFIELDDPSAPAFHSNLSVDIDIVTAEKPNVLKVRRGPALEDGGVAEVLLLRDTYAVRTDVRLGMNERQYVEIIDGLAAGDRIVISDTSAWDGMSEVRVIE